MKVSEIYEKQGIKSQLLPPKAWSKSEHKWHYIVRSARIQQEVERRSYISPLRPSVATLLLQEKPASRFQLCSPE